jgi:hypothetical protein
MTHAIVTGEPDDRETITSGSAGGRAADPSAWHNAFNRFQRCYERREKVIDAFFDLADAIITVPSLIRRAWGHPPLGHPTRPTALINTSIRATSKLDV